MYNEKEKEFEELKNNNKSNMDNVFKARMENDIKDIHNKYLRVWVILKTLGNPTVKNKNSWSRDKLTSDQLIVGKMWGIVIRDWNKKQLYRQSITLIKWFRWEIWKFEKKAQTLINIKF